MESYNYYKTAASKNHPIANWFIGYMYYNGYVGNKSEEDYKMAWEYYLKAEKLGCIATINSIGLAYLEGSVPGHTQKDKEKAIQYFEKAIKQNYVYAFNNLGLIYEKEEEYKKAFELYKKAADLGQSWAANRVGEFYRLGKGINKDEKEAFKYYKASAEASIYEICLWSKYNLAKHFYENGNVNANIKKDENLAKDLFEEARKGRCL